MACNDYHYLSQIDDSTERWKVKVRVSRKWNVIDFETKEDTLRIDMVLLDEKGDQVHATIPKRQIMKFSSILEEGGVYFLHKFNVSPVKNNFRPVQHPYRVFIKWDTIIKPVFDIRPTFPKYKFDFVEYGHIKLRLQDKTYLTDVYGKLTGFSNEKIVESGRLQEIFLKDRSGSNLKVTLWGQIIDQFPNDIVNSSTSCPVVVVTSLTVKLFDGEYSVSSTTATKLYVNLDISEVDSLKGIVSDEDNTVKLIEASSTAITLEERMVSNRKTLVEIVQALPYAFIGEKVTFRAIISEIIYDFEPFYFSCPNKDCRKKVVQRGQRHWCNNCIDFIDCPVARYKINVGVRDHTYSCLISIFDREVERLLQRPVTEVVDLNAMDNGAEAVKDILEKLVGLEFIFEIKISEFNRRDESVVPSFTASKVLTIDEEIESTHFPKQIEEQKKMKSIVEDVTSNKMKRVADNITDFGCSSQSIHVVEDVPDRGQKIYRRKLFPKDGL